MKRQLRHSMNSSQGELEKDAALTFLDFEQKLLK
jgi:hypothetical protein